MKKGKNAHESLIKYEAQALANIANLMSDNQSEAREFLEQLMDEALKRLYTIPYTREVTK